MSLFSPVGIIKTTDGGLNWVSQGVINIREIQFINLDTGYGTGFIGTNGAFWKTTNGGVNWNGTNLGGITYTDLFFVNKDTGWFSGGDGMFGGVWRTTDGGVSFTRYLTAATSFDVIFFLKQKVNGEYIGWTARTPLMYRTTSSGVNWVLIHNGFTGFCNGNSIVDMYFKDSLNGIITRGGNCFNVTTNAGYNWTLINRPNMLNSKIAMGTTDIGWLTLTTDTVIKTFNFFQTYGLQKTPISTNKIFAVDTSIAYSATSQTSVIKTTNGGGNLVKVGLISSEVPLEYKLYPNYPNPFNPSTNFKYQIINNSFVILKIYDILGRMIETLVNEKQIAGSYEANWDAGNNSSGIYLYELTVYDSKENNLYKNTKKMMLVK